MVKSYIPSTEGTMYDMVHHYIIDGNNTEEGVLFSTFVQKEKRKVIFKCYHTYHTSYSIFKLNLWARKNSKNIYNSIYTAFHNI